MEFRVGAISESIKRLKKERDSYLYNSGIGRDLYRTVFTIALTIRSVNPIRSLDPPTDDIRYERFSAKDAQRIVLLQAELNES